MISIIIPAHDEAAVIRRNLDALLTGLTPAKAEILVVCNGCTDDTAAIARRYGPPVRVFETDIPSKANALNLADRYANGFPRFYVDADVQLSGDSVRRLAAILERGPYLAAAPAMAMRFGNANWLVRAYYRVWSVMPYTQEGFMGSGVYAMSRPGRERIGAFPNLIGDDAYVRMSFAPSERTIVPTCKSVVSAPATMRALVRIKTRSRLGLYQIRQSFPGLYAREASTKQYRRAIAHILRDPSLWICTLPYLWANLVSRYRAKKQIRRVDCYRWERDTSS